MTSPLAGTSWTISVPGHQPTGAQAVVEFDHESLAGTTGCNRFRAAYECDADVLRVTGPIMSTMRLCPEPTMQLEAAVTSAFERCARWQRRDERVTMLDGDGAVLAELAPIGPEALHGEWVVTSIHWPERQAVISVDGDLDITFEAGTVHGSGGCNHFSGTWRAEGSTLSFGALASTMMHCGDDVIAQESAFHRALATVVGWRLESDHVSLLRDGGTIAVTLRRRGNG